jgi:hypothetical protein
LSSPGGIVHSVLEPALTTAAAPRDGQRCLRRISDFQGGIVSFAGAWLEGRFDKKAARHERPRHFWS